tara:strand:+ start:141 stop:755 length:615 start_codon:yes stop_codon:yes gene_type:complete
MSKNSGIDHIFKILLIGDSGVGKSSILLQFTDGYFNENLSSTIGVDFRIKVIELDDLNKKVKATIWDTAGQERFRTLTKAYYRGAQGCCFVYDVSRPESFEQLNEWLKELEMYAADGGEYLVKVLLGNKIDTKQVVDDAVASKWAEENGMLFLKSSAKTREGINNVFEELIRKILDSDELLKRTTNKSQTALSASSQNNVGCSC